MKRSLAIAMCAGVVIGAVVVRAQDTKKAAPAAKAAAPAKAKAAAPVQTKGTAAGGLTDLRQQASYGFGLGLGRQFKAQAIDLEPTLIARGIADALAGAKPLLSDEQLQVCMQEFEQQVQAKQAEAIKGLADKHKAEGEAFLAKNKALPGVKVTKSGLQYKILSAGTGATPKATETVTTHYKGTLIDGTEFDSSYKRGEPTSFPVDGVIAGWTEALQLMKVGDKWQLVIPSELAYGDQPQQGGPIPPNAVLVFEIELLEVKDAPAAPK